MVQISSFYLFITSDLDQEFRAGSTSEELWELRNSLLHMTNLESHRVKKRVVRQLTPAFTHPSIETLPANGDIKLFDAARFLLVILPTAIEQWLNTYVHDQAKIFQFIRRYDTIVSESRTLEASLDNP